MLFKSPSKILLELTVMASIAASCSVQTKVFTTTDGTRYAYDYAPAQGDNSTVLLLHGFPATRHDWHYQVEDLTAAGYGVIAPDLLGYGDSDRPVDVEKWRLKIMAGHLTEILDDNDIETVVGVGHDWGTSVLSRSAVWHPERFEKLVFMSVGYSPPGVFFDVDATNAFGIQSYGYPPFGYWYFFNSYDAGGILESHIESLFDLTFPQNISAWPEMLCNLGAARAWLTNNTTTPRAEYITEEDKQVWIKAFCRKGAFESALNTYRCIMRGIQDADEAVLTEEDRQLNVPILSIGGLRDRIISAETVPLQFATYATAQYTNKTLDTGHWMMYEDREGTSKLLIDFLSS